MSIVCQQCCALSVLMQRIRLSGPRICSTILEPLLIWKIDVSVCTLAISPERPLADVDITQAARHCVLYRIGLVGPLVAPVAPTKRLAYATRCSRCTLRWQQSTTLPGMVLGLNKSCQHPTKMAFWKDARGRTWEQSPIQRTEPSIKSVKRKAIKGLSSRRALTCFEGALMMV